jgi:ketosteroid isomerase-like protein
VTETEIQDIEKNVKSVFDKMTEYSEDAELDLFLSCYDNSPTFLHFSSDGKMRNYQEFKKICIEYYDALKEQEIQTILEKIQVIDTNLAVVSWTGNIIARFKSGDIMKMNHYSISSMFKKIDSNWKIIHSHESSLPPEFIKKER